MNFTDSLTQSSEDKNQPQNLFRVSSSLAQRLDDKKDQQLTQYFNVDNHSFQNSQNTRKNPNLWTDRSNNPNIQYFSSFPSLSFQNKQEFKKQNKFSSTHQNFARKEQNTHSDDTDFLFKPKHQIFKQSKVEQSLQKAFSLNRNTHRIPFKKKENQKSYQDETKQKGYNFYKPSYEEYLTKQNKIFWKEAFEKFYEKKGSLQNIDYPSFHNKEQSKSSQQYSENKKVGTNVTRANDDLGTGKIQSFIGKCSSLNTILLLALLIIGLKILFQ